MMPKRDKTMLLPKNCECGFSYSQGIRQHLDYLHKQRHKMLVLLVQLKDMKRGIVGMPVGYLRRVDRAVDEATNGD